MTIDKPREGSKKSVKFSILFDLKFWKAGEGVGITNMVKEIVLCKQCSLAAFKPESET